MNIITITFNFNISLLLLDDLNASQTVTCIGVADDKNSK